MEIILKENVANIGFKDELVSVKAGYGRNFLIPTGKAILATDSAKKVLAENLESSLVSALVILPAIVKLGCVFVNEPVIVSSGDCKPAGTALPPAVDVAVVFTFIVKVNVSEGLLCKKTNSSVILKL